MFDTVANDFGQLGLRRVQCFQRRRLTELNRACRRAEMITEVSSLPLVRGVPEPVTKFPEL